MGSSLPSTSTDSGTSMPIESGEESISSMKLTKLSAAPWLGMEVPPHARAGWVGRGHRFAAYPRCSADLAGVRAAGQRSAEDERRRESDVGHSGEARSATDWRFVAGAVAGREGDALSAFRNGRTRGRSWSLQSVRLELRLGATMRVCVYSGRPRCCAMRGPRTCLPVGIPIDGVEYGERCGVNDWRRMSAQCHEGTRAAAGVDELRGHASAAA